MKRSLFAQTDNDLVQMYDRNEYKQIEAFYRHPDFDGRYGTKNDLGLIRLDSPLKFNETVQPACLDFEEREIYEGALKVSLAILDPKTLKLFNDGVPRNTLIFISIVIFRICLI